MRVFIPLFFVAFHIFTYQACAIAGDIARDMVVAIWRLSMVLMLFRFSFLDIRFAICAGLTHCLICSSLKSLYYRVLIRTHSHALS